MGIDIRNVPADAAQLLPDRFRKAGFNVEVRETPHSEHSGVVITRIYCGCGIDEIMIGVVPDFERVGECRVLIPNQSGRRYQLQSDVTAIIERSGGYWPFPE